MNSYINAVNNILIGSCISIAIMLVIFLLFFITNTYLITQERKIKKKYNEISTYFTWNSFTFLEFLSSKAEQLKGVISRLDEARKFYKEQTGIIKLKIMKITSSNRQYDFVCSFKLLKEIKIDIKKIENLNHLIKDIYTSTTDYNQSVNSTIAWTRICFDNINNFYDKILYQDFKNSAFNWIKKEISYMLIDLNDKSLKMENEKIIEILTLLNEKNNNFYRFLKTIYIYTEANFYLIRCQKQIEEILLKQNNLFTDTELTNIIKIQIDTRILLNDLSLSLKELNLDKVKHLIFSISIKLEPILNTIKNNDLINFLIQEGITYCTNTIELWTNNLPNLKNSLDNIGKYFNSYNNDEIEKKIKELDSSFKKACIYHKSINQENSKLSNVDRVSFLRKINWCIENLSNWQKELEEFTKYVINKYDDSIKLINKIYDLNWTIQQLNVFNTSLSAHSNVTINFINSCISSVNNLTKIIKHNFSSNFQEAKNMVAQLEKSIEPLYNSFLLTKTLKNYAKNLLFFSNKYRHENEKIKDSISHCEQLYQQNKYKEVLDELIPVLDNIKKSAKINNVKFS